MYNTLVAQYEMVKSARGVLLSYCNSLKVEDLAKPIPEFNGNSIKNLLVHTANTYIHWLIKIAEKKSHDFFEEDPIKNIADIIAVYKMVDQTTSGFLQKFRDNLNTETIFNHPTKNIKLKLSPLQLFTHVITHEFHHKGQILTMSRIMGYQPVDTDIIRT